MDDIAELVRLCQGKELPGGRPPQDFARNVQWRVANEAWMARHSWDFFNIRDRQSPFRKYVTDQTHYLLVREGYVWDLDSGGFAGVDQATYDGARRRVLSAVIQHVCGNFIDVGDEVWPRQPGMHVRIDLKPYLGAKTDLSSKVEA